MDFHGMMARGGWLVALAGGVSLGHVGKAHGVSSDEEPAALTLAVLTLRTTALDTTPTLTELLSSILDTEAAAWARRHARVRIVSGPPSSPSPWGRAAHAGMDVESLGALGRAVGAQRLLAAHVGRVGRTHTIHIKLVDVPEGRLLRQARQLTRGPREAVASALRSGVRDVLGALRPPANVPRLGRSAEAAAVWPVYASAVLLTAGASAISASVVLGLRSEHAADRAATAGFDGGQRTLVRARRDRHNARVAAGVGVAAAAVGAAVWWLTGASAPRSSVDVAPIVVPQGAAMLLRASY